MLAYALPARQALVKPPQKYFTGISQFTVSRSSQAEPKFHISPIVNQTTSVTAPRSTRKATASLSIGTAISWEPLVFGVSYYLWSSLATRTRIRWTDTSGFSLKIVNPIDHVASRMSSQVDHNKVDVCYGNILLSLSEPTIWLDWYGTMLRWLTTNRFMIRIQQQ